MFTAVTNSFREGLLILSCLQDRILFSNWSAENIFNGGVMLTTTPKLTAEHLLTEQKFKLVDFADLPADATPDDISDHSHFTAM